MHISEVAKKYGLSVRTLRYYEEINLYSLERDRSNVRIFDDSNLQRLELIVALKKIGLSLAEIKEIICNEPEEYIEILERAQYRLSEEMKVISRMHSTLRFLINKHDDHSLLAFIEDLRDSRSDERKKSMESKMTINIGQHLVPYAVDESNSILEEVKNVKWKLCNAFDFGPIRIRDVDYLNDLEVQVLWENREVERYEVTKGREISTFAQNLERIMRMIAIK